MITHMGICCILAFLAVQMALGEQSFSLRRPREATEIYSLASFGGCRCADGPYNGLLISSSGDSLKFCVYHGHVFLGRLYPPDDYLLPHGYVTPPDASHQHVSPPFLEPCSSREARLLSALQSAIDHTLSERDQQRIHNAVQGEFLSVDVMQRVLAIAPVRRDDVEALEFLLHLRSQCEKNKDTGELE